MGDADRESRPWRFAGGVAVAVAFLLAMGLGAAFATSGERGDVVVADDGTPVAFGLRWPGAIESCVTGREPGNCYREAIDGGVIKQPVSTWTTATFVVVGLVLLRRADRRPEGAPPGSTAFGFIALLMGPGSALFHGTLTSWGGFFDQLSMYALLSGIVATDLAVAGRARYGVVFWPAIAATGVLKVVSGEAATIVFIVAGIGVGVWTLVAVRHLPAWAGRERDRRRWALALVLLGAAIVPWLVSNPSVGHPTDAPWHGAWHVLSAAFVGAYGWYLASERPVSTEVFTVTASQS